MARTNARLDELNTQLNELMDCITTVMLRYQKDAIVVRRDLQKKLPAIGKDRLNEVCYGLIKSTYLKS